MKLLVVFLYICWGSLSFGDTLPPIGERIYIIDSEKSQEVVRIEREKKRAVALKNGETVLRDPREINSPDAQRFLEDEKVKKEKKTQNVSIAFDAEPIKGRHAEPRVAFRSERLESQPLIDQVPHSFHSKILEDAQQISADVRLRKP